jgi:8-oxo-dGTP pyrophosphatase MutT (NUDIX family)
VSNTSNEEFDPTTVPVKPAATVLLVRDADAGGVEVFMLRRTFNAAFASGMFVFPGGKVDDVDGVDEIAELCDGLTDSHASALLGIASGGLAYWVACIRECFEEAGVLLARHESTGELCALTMMQQRNDLKKSARTFTMVQLHFLICVSERDFASPLMTFTM